MSFRRRLVGLLLGAVLAGCPAAAPEQSHEDVNHEEGADWCAGHGVPESKCTLCNPQLIPQFKAAGDWCAEHGLPESVCPQCNGHREAAPEAAGTRSAPGTAPPAGTPGARGTPEAGASGTPPQAAAVARLKSPDLEETAGIRTQAARRVESGDGIRCTARLAFDADRLAEVRALVPGVIRDVHAALGAKVERGAPLFELESPRVGELQAALAAAEARTRTARAALDREQRLLEKEVGTPREVELARQEHAAARAQVRAAESSLRLIGAPARAPRAAGRFVLTAPVSGTVVRRPGVLGLLADEATPLATIADTSRLWALCDVPEGDAGRLALGQAVEVEVDGGAGTFKGEVTWIASEVDPRTRTVAARAELENPDGRLRAGQFARARIETVAPRAALQVPREAVQRLGEGEVVFVRTAPGVYESRAVRRLPGGDRAFVTGEPDGGDPAYVQGELREGEAVVTTGAVLLKTELLPGSIGAGCCETEPPGGS